MSVMRLLTAIFIIQILCFKAYSGLNPVPSSVSTGAISSAMGGAGRAAVAPGDVSTLNPGTLAHLRGYFFYTQYLPGESYIGISDNTYETAIPSAVYYQQIKENKDFVLSFAEKVNKKLSVGISAHYYQIMDPEILKSKNLMNLDLGLSYTPRVNMGFGMVFYDLANSPGIFSDNNLKIFPKLGFGYHYMYRAFFRFRVDYLSGNSYKFNEGHLMFGFEDYLNRWTAFRIGYSKPFISSESEIITAGLGFDLPKFKINYAYASETKDQPEIRHSVDFMVPF